ncbi:MFS transporter [Nisaea acidiphila]|uniref:MFS transporter n=1 Tax=Nisaea acidiphila TaxID=1862145 RepID=A0A9J7AWH5_9PROT|nr:MFS transporter [Nisaea acidiphila]UUX50604.1 MFS transporter [Nisaea acidiphila]
MPENTRPARTATLGLLSLALAMGIGRFAFTPLFPMMQQDGTLDIPGGSLLAAANFVGYWMGALSAAALPMPPRNALRLALIATGLVTAAMGFTEHYWLWLALRWLAGLFSAWTLIIVSNHVIRALAEAGETGRQGWVFAGVGTGIALAGIACLGFMVAGLSANASWIALGGGTLLLAGLLSLLIGAEVPTIRKRAADGASERTPLVWRVVIAYGTMGLGYIIPATYLPLMARQIVPDPMVFGWSWPVFGLAAALSTIAARNLFARHGNRKVWAAGQAVMALGLLLPALAPNMATIILSGLMVGGTFMVITMAGMKEAHVIAPPGDVSRHIAVLTTAFATGQIVGPPAASLLRELTGSFSTGLLGAAVLLLLTALPIATRCGYATSRGTAPTS